MATADKAQQKVETVKEQSLEVAQDTGDHARQVAETARQQAEEVARQASDRGRELLRDMGRELQAQVDSQADRAGGTLRQVSGQLRAMADAAPDDGGVVSLVREAAQRTDELAQRLDTGGPTAVLDDVAEFARRRPGLFLVGTGLAGFVAGRLLRNADLGQVKDAVTSGSAPGRGDPHQPEGPPNQVGSSSATTSRQSQLRADTSGGGTPATKAFRR